MIARLRGQRVYVDANVIVYSVEGFEKYAGVARALLSAAEQDEYAVVTSELTLAEAIVVPHRNGQPEIVAAYEGMLRSRRSFEVVPVSRVILRLSGSLRASIGGKLPDSIHGATATVSNCALLVTADRTFRSPPGLELVLLDDLLPNRNG